MEGFEWVMEIGDGMTAPASQMRSALSTLSTSLRATEAEMRRLQGLQNTYRSAGFKQGAEEVGRDLAKLRLHAGELKAITAPLKSSLASVEAEERKLAAAAERADKASAKLAQQGLAQAAREASKLAAAAERAARDQRQLAESSKATQSATMDGMAGALGLSFGLAEVARGAKDAYVEMAHLTLAGLELAVQANETREHLTRMFSGLGGGAAAGGAMYETIQKLRTVVPESEEEISRWAATLMAAGMTDPGRVEASIRAMASASALMGGGAMGQEASGKIETLTAKSLETGKFKGLGKSLVGTGLSAADLADQLGMSEENFQAAFKKGTISAERGIAAMNAALTKKGAGALQGTMGEWPTLVAKAKEGFAHMFDGVNVEPLMEALRGLVGLLDASKPSGQAMRATLVSVFTDVAKSAGTAVAAITRDLLYVELGVLKLMHYMAPMNLQWRAWERNGTALLAIKTILVAIGGLAAVVAVAFAAAAYPVLEMARAFMAAVEAAARLKYMITGVGEASGDIKIPSMSGGASGGVFGASNPAAPATTVRAPANAEGGIVQPARGEALASVAPGEAIVPRGKLAVGPGAAPSPGGGGDTHNHIDIGGIHIDGAGKSAPEILAMLESAVADLFGRAANEAGA